MTKSGVRKTSNDKKFWDFLSQLFNSDKKPNFLKMTRTSQYVQMQGKNFERNTKNLKNFRLASLGDFFKIHLADSLEKSLSKHQNDKKFLSK